MNRKRLLNALLLSISVIIIWSMIRPYDIYTWILEALPVLIGLGILIPTYRRFPLTSLVYILIWIHAIILLIGAHYTYARVPLFNTFVEWEWFARNHYDRIGHLAQGFIPAMIAREIFLRRSPLKRGKWLFFLVPCFCLGFSAFYELIEWWIALLSEEAAESFLGTQGDVWDTQWDMFLALCGAITAQITLAKQHDKQLARL